MYLHGEGIIFLNGEKILQLNPSLFYDKGILAGIDIIALMHYYGSQHVPLMRCCHKLYIYVHIVADTVGYKSPETFITPQNP